MATSAAIGVLGGLLGSARLLAIAIELGRHPRPTFVDDQLSLREALYFLTVRSQESWQVDGHPYVWPEYYAYVGIPVLVLAAIGLVIAFRRGQIRVVVGTLLFGSLMMGNLGALSPWALLHHLPVFDSLRVPSRFAVLFLGQLGLCAAFALDELRERASGRAPKITLVAMSAVVLAIGVDLMIVTRPIVSLWEGSPVPLRVEHPRFFQESEAYFASKLLSAPALGRGTLGCYVVLSYSPSPALRGGDVPQSWIAAGEGEVREVSRTTNTLSLDVEARAPVIVVLNRNYLPDFKANRGEIVEHEGLLALKLPAGEMRVVITFAPSSIRLAALPSVLGLALFAYLLYSGRKRSLSA